MKLSGVYKIQSIINPERIYIGSSLNIRDRWSRHLNSLRKGDHHSLKLQRHFDKYGKIDLVLIIIEPCFPEFLFVREQYYIDTLNPFFNICKITGEPSHIGLFGEDNPMFGKHHTIESKLQSSKAHKGKTAWNKGKKGVPKETSKKMSDSAKKRPPMSEETRENHSKGMKGRNTWAKGSKYSEETLKKHQGKTPWNKGKVNPYSEKTLSKMVEGRKKAYNEKHQNRVA